jgi:hypothetical protein
MRLLAPPSKVPELLHLESKSGTLLPSGDSDLPLVKPVRRATLAVKSPVSGEYWLNFVAVRLNRTENRSKRPGPKDPGTWWMLG